MRSRNYSRDEDITQYYKSKKRESSKTIIGWGNWLRTKSVGKINSEIKFSKWIKPFLQNGCQLLKNSALLEFLPFLDSEKKKQVSERFQKLKFSLNEKYPILIPSKGKFIELHVSNAHEKFSILEWMIHLYSYVTGFG